jgi:hypothetical protein
MDFINTPKELKDFAQQVLWGNAISTKTKSSREGDNQTRVAKAVESNAEAVTRVLEVVGLKWHSNSTYTNWTVLICLYY